MSDEQEDMVLEIEQVSKLTFPEFLSVSDYGKSFGRCEDAVQDAVDQGREMVERLLGEERTALLTFTGVFSEFDSGNRGHAVGLFDISVFGSDEVIKEAVIKVGKELS